MSTTTVTRAIFWTRCPSRVHTLRACHSSFHPSLGNYHTGSAYSFNDVGSEFLLDEQTVPQVAVRNPEKHGEGFKDAYVTYEIFTNVIPETAQSPLICGMMIVWGWQEFQGATKVSGLYLARGETDRGD